MPRIVVTVQDDERSMPQAPDDTCDDSSRDTAKRRETGQQIATPAELLTKSEDHIERQYHNESKQCLCEKVKCRQLVGRVTKGYGPPLTVKRISKGTPHLMQGVRQGPVL